jgi:hypothetical protein
MEIRMTKDSHSNARLNDIELKLIALASRMSLVQTYRISLARRSGVEERLVPFGWLCTKDHHPLAQNEREVGDG